jgi:iron complex transport system permease protein
VPESRAGAAPGLAAPAQLPTPLKFLALAVVVLLSFWLSLYVGRGEAGATRFFELRLQRSGVAFLAGAALALSGVIVQGLFRNPLASPSVLGTTSGAELGGELMLVGLYAVFQAQPPLGLPAELFMPLGCVVGALVSLAIVLLLTPLRASAVALLLTGFLLAALFGSLSALVKSLIQESWQLTRVLSTFSLGSVTGAGPRQLAIAALLGIGAALPAWLWSRELDLLMSGEEEAQSLGVDVSRLRVWSVVWTAFATAGAVAVGANVAFVGLIVPHALRKLFGHSHRILMPAAFLGGGIFLLWCDMLCRVLPTRNEIPLSVVTALIGGPLFLRLLSRLDRGMAP